jgi:DMSO/TMAO reductase YedYZ molybdopterin-dependent catalytic subunit
MAVERDLARRDLLKGGIALGGMAATAGMPFWSQLAMAQDEVLVPFTDVPEGFTAPPVTAGAVHFLDTRLIDTFYTPVDDFYLVQHYNQPDIDKATYKLRVTGLVDKPFEISYEALLGRPKVEIDAGFECGGNGERVFQGLIGNARWGGVRLRDLLSEAGVQAPGIEVVVYSYTAGDLAIAIAYVVLDKSDPIAAAWCVIDGYTSKFALRENELDVLWRLVLLRLAMSACLAVYQQRLRPQNDYLLISQRLIRENLPRLLATDLRK